VTKSMLLNGSNDDEDMEDKDVDMEDHEEEAKRNIHLLIMEKIRVRSWSIKTGKIKRS
jgi:hypothetical protein